MISDTIAVGNWGWCPKAITDDDPPPPFYIPELRSLKSRVEDSTPSYAPVPVGIASTEPAEWTWNEGRGQWSVDAMNLATTREAAVVCWQGLGFRFGGFQVLNPITLYGAGYALNHT
ncbi:hypothetical protein AVEN_251668-1 [Araneus ventricosus]|uniref:Uncharacterized protein n=1 Tax=Araneus ventricosus TaxID=182803 RepID=A0A4Y2HFK6_ARAVE|nr:hypothetical protein AVEN_251668-1 [Araneus ventricosus]